MTGAHRSNRCPVSVVAVPPCIPSTGQPASEDSHPVLSSSGSSFGRGIKEMAGAHRCNRCPLSVAVPPCVPSTGQPASEDSHPVLSYSSSVSSFGRGIEEMAGGTEEINVTITRPLS